jgi:hypothetical protein
MRGAKIPGIVTKFILKHSYRAPLPLLETSKIFNRNAVKGRQHFSLNLYFNEMPPFWPKAKW